MTVGETDFDNDIPIDLAAPPWKGARQEQKGPAVSASMDALATLNPITLGIISDTHGWLPPAVAGAFEGVDAIIHAGDVDGPSVLAQLQRIAPVIGIRGNMDHGEWAKTLKPAALATLGGKTFYILHNLSALDLAPEVADIDVVVSGHTHQPEIMKKDGVLYLNPGSAAFPRHGSVAGGLMVRVDGDAIDVRPLTFDDAGGGS